MFNCFFIKILIYKVEISVTGSKTDVKKKKPFNKYQINCLNKQQFKENSKVEQCYRLVSTNTKIQLIKKKKNDCILLSNILV